MSHCQVDFQVFQRGNHVNHCDGDTFNINYEVCSSCRNGLTKPCPMNAQYCMNKEWSGNVTVGLTSVSQTRRILFTTALEGHHQPQRHSRSIRIHLKMNRADQRVMVSHG